MKECTSLRSGFIRSPRASHNRWPYPYPYPCPYPYPTVQNTGQVRSLMGVSPREAALSLPEVQPLGGYAV